MADAMQQASFSSQPSDVQSMMDKASERTGIPFDIVETITIGYPESAAESIRQAPYGNMIVTREPIDFVAVIRCLESFDEDKLLEFLKSPEKVSDGGKNYYSVDGQRGVFVADSQTLVVGTISELHAAIESEGKSHPIEIFNSVDPSFHITFLMDLEAFDSFEENQYAHLRKNGFKYFGTATRFTDSKTKSIELWGFDDYKQAWVRSAITWLQNKPNEMDCEIRNKTVAY